MTLEQIYASIQPELETVKTVLANQFRISTETESITDDIVSYFFQSSGKLLRPALVLLSAHAVSDGTGTNHGPVISAVSSVDLAVVMELIHSASLIHDDILDESLVRRGQVALDKMFDPKVAVLAGDLLFTRAFALLSRNFSSRISGIVANCVEMMCRAEIDEANGKIPTYTRYVNLLRNKTANLMSACCECAAVHAAADKDTAAVFRDFGLHFGLAYQLLDDHVDQDAPTAFAIDRIQEALKFIELAKHDISGLHNTNYKKSLIDLILFLEERCMQLSGEVKM